MHVMTPEFETYNIRKSSDLCSKSADFEYVQTGGSCAAAEQVVISENANQRYRKEKRWLIKEITTRSWESARQPVIQN